MFGIFTLNLVVMLTFSAPTRQFTYILVTATSPQKGKEFAAEMIEIRWGQKHCIGLNESFVWSFNTSTSHLPNLYLYIKFFIHFARLEFVLNSPGNFPELWIFRFVSNTPPSKSWILLVASAWNVQIYSIPFTGIIEPNPGYNFPCRKFYKGQI